MSITDEMEMIIITMLMVETAIMTVVDKESSLMAIVTSVTVEVSFNSLSCVVVFLSVTSITFIGRHVTEIKTNNERNSKIGVTKI